MTDESLDVKRKEVSSLRDLANEYCLQGRELLCKYSDAQLACIYNGCGPERWPSWAREKLDGYVSLYAAAILIHDVQYHESDGNVATFDKVCESFEDNVCTIMGIRYPFFTWAMLKPSYRAERAYWRTVGILLSSAVSTYIAKREYIRQYEEA